VRQEEALDRRTWGGWMPPAGRQAKQVLELTHSPRGRAGEVRTGMSSVTWRQGRRKGSRIWLIRPA